jgi:hypothetical protein
MRLFTDSATLAAGRKGTSDVGSGCLSLQLFRGNGVTSVVELNLPLQWLIFHSSGSSGEWEIGFLVAVDMLIRRHHLHCQNRVSDLQVQVEFREHASAWTGMRLPENLASPGESLLLSMRKRHLHWTGHWR